MNKALGIRAFQIRVPAETTEERPPKLYQQISKSAFDRRKEAFIEGAREGKFLADPDARGKPKANPMSDPAAMEGMMGAMKGNMMMMIPQSVIMGWINAFFAGFVVCMSLSLPVFLVSELRAHGVVS